MTVLPPFRGTDWTDRERAEIDRLEAHCRDLGHSGLECTHTDTGDPFCVVYDEHPENVVLHIARIDRRYVVDSPGRARSVTLPTIEVAIDIAITQLTLLA
jgi:hypothetical protein